METWAEVSKGHVHDPVTRNYAEVGFYMTAQERAIRGNGTTVWMQFAQHFAFRSGTSIFDRTFIDSLISFSSLFMVKDIRAYVDAGCIDVENIKNALECGIDPELAKSIEAGTNTPSTGQTL